MNDDYLPNSELKDHLEEQTLRRNTSDTPKCVQCGISISAGDSAYIVAWTPPASSVADSSTVDRNWHRMEFYCPSHEDAALNSFSEMKKTNFKENDVALFSATIVEKYDELRLNKINFKDRSLPESWG